MFTKTLTLIACAGLSALLLVPEPAEARIGYGGGFRGGGFRGAAIGGFRGGAIGWRGGAIGWRGAALGWRPGWGWRGGWGWRRGWGWGLGAAAIGAGLVASSYYPYWDYPYDYGYYPAAYGYGYGGYGGCVLQRRPVLTNWGYQSVLVRVCY